MTLDPGAVVRNLYFAWNGVLWVAAGPQGVYRVTPGSPVTRHYPVAEGEVLDVYVPQNIAYVARGDYGMEMLDISGPGFVKLDHTAESATHLVGVGDGGLDLYASESGDYESVVHRFTNFNGRIAEVSYFQGPPSQSLFANPVGLWISGGDRGLTIAAPFADPAPNHPPIRPRGLSPFDGATGVELTPFLTETAFADIDGASTPLGQNGGGYFTVLNTDLSVVSTGFAPNNQYEVPAGSLQPFTKYYWYAYQDDASGDDLTHRSLRTGFSSFTTGDGTTTVNTPPTASAGSNVAVVPGQIVLLNATGSTDAEGNALTYNWYQATGPLVTINNPFSANADFVAPTMDTTGTMIVGVVVSDGGASSSATTTVTVVLGDTPPEPPQIIRPAPDQVITVGSAFEASAFVDVDPADAHTGIRWQIAADADTTFAAPVLTEETGPTTSLAVPAWLVSGEYYRVRVSYQDSYGVFGDYSQSVRFLAWVPGDEEIWEVY